MPDRQDDVRLPEGAVPGEGVVIVRIDKGAVQIEDCSGLPWVPPSSRSRCRRRPSTANERLASRLLPVLLDLLALTTGSFDQILQVDPTEPLGEGSR